MSEPIESKKEDVTKEELDATSYVELLKKQKESSVSKELYEKLVEENKVLAKSLQEGNYTKDDDEEPNKDLNELRKELFNQEHSNLEYARRALELRTEVIKQGGVDPFLPNGPKVSPTDEDVKCANRVAQVMQECIDYAEGDSELFTNELMRRTTDAGRFIYKR